MNFVPAAIDMTQNDPPLPAVEGELERFRGYLHVLASMQVGNRHAGMVDPSDLVQQTLLTAHRKRDQFRGATREELGGWLRRILGNEMTQALRFRSQAKRDHSRERSIHADIDASSRRLDALLVATQSTPSERLTNHEQLLLVTNALSALTESQRTAIVMRYTQEKSLDDIAAQLGCSAPAVVGLLKRGLKQIRNVLDIDSSNPGS